MKREETRKFTECRKIFYRSFITGLVPARIILLGNDMKAGVFMNPRANITIYGLWNGITGGYNNYSYARAMGTQFNELVELIRESDIAHDVDIFFVDLMVDLAPEAYEMVRGLYNLGYRLPYVTINGKPVYYGDIPVWEIYNNAKSYIEYGYIYDYE